MQKIMEVVECLKVWSRPKGFDPIIPFAQAHLETGGFMCEASKHNNFFGFYKTDDWKGDVWDCPTHEWETINGKSVYVPKIIKFKIFPTVGDCFGFYEKYTGEKFPKSKIYRGQYRLYYKELMTYILDGKGRQQIIYPSFCSSVGYELACIRRYETLTANHELIFAFQ